MSSQPKYRYTLEEYFELERASEVKYEYFNGEVFAMSGASPEHEAVFGNVFTSLRNQLRGRSCSVFSSNLRVKVPAAPPYRYPDLTALCAQPEYEVIGGIRALTNPTLIVEVLSSSTEGYDRGDKFIAYKSIPSLGEYLLIAQHRPHVTHYVKQPDGKWSYEDANEITDTLMLPTLDCTLALSEVYQDVTFAEAEGHAPPPER
ncbi:MAG: Uma2 family endonuclease [Pyrinomonadaceae bacterium MAG19_C2-C3]|nr:Uma2 family endonuclease [Pyrinomonadaceae bacterium MAG19_C2-C3]